MRDIGFTEICGNFSTDVITGIVYGDGVVISSLKLNARHIELPTLLVLLNFLLGGLLYPGPLSTFEEFERCFVRLVHVSRVWTFQLHEPFIGLTLTLQARWNSVTLIAPLLISLFILRRIASQCSVKGASSESSSELLLLSESDSDSIAEKGRLDVALLMKIGPC